MTSFWVWTIAILTIAAILVRPRQWPEAVWACLAAVLLVATGLLPISAAVGAAAKGADVYLFLIGMMLLSELARLEGVFDWMAVLAVRAAHGSRTRLFALVYLVGTVVTVFLSNDATAVVLTPAVYAAVKKAKVTALPYLFICAFIANAASFVLPISNPANLVVYGSTMPSLLGWLKLFLLPSLISIAVTFFVLRFLSRSELAGELQPAEPLPLAPEARRALWGMILTGIALIAASALGMDLGRATCIAAVCAVLFATRGHWARLRQMATGISWSILPLVAGLFVVVEALAGAGALQDVGEIFKRLAALPPVAASVSSAFALAGLSNLMNNLPSGLLAGAALQAVPVPGYVRHAVLIGVDLGPNLSVTGSLATILWSIALRREGEHVSGWKFLKTGVLVMIPALLLAALAIPFTAH